MEEGEEVEEVEVEEVEVEEVKEEVGVVQDVQVDVVQEV